jgi:hypothetical protein
MGPVARDEVWIMRIREKVFGSASERELYKALHSTWSGDFNLWPSLPFLSLIDLDGDEVSPSEWIPGTPYSFPLPYRGTFVSADGGSVTTCEGRHCK